MLVPWHRPCTGRFAAGKGDDVVYSLEGGRFLGARGDDRAIIQRDGRFYGGPGNDRVENVCGGRQWATEHLFPGQNCPS